MRGKSIHRTKIDEAYFRTVLNVPFHMPSLQPLSFACKECLKNFFYNVGSKESNTLVGSFPFFKDSPPFIFVCAMFNSDVAHKHYLHYIMVDQ